MNIRYKFLIISFISELLYTSKIMNKSMVFKKLLVCIIVFILLICSMLLFIENTSAKNNIIKIIKKNSLINTKNCNSK